MTTATTKIDIQQIRQDKTTLFDALSKAGAKFNGSNVVCPFHADKSPSGQIYSDSDGVWRYKCHAASCGFCGDVFDVQAKVENRPLEDVLRDASGNQPEPPEGVNFFETVEAACESIHWGKIESVFKYSNPVDGKIELAAIRIRRPDNSKTFMQVSHSRWGFAFKAPEKPWPLYNRTRLANAEIVVVVEGEKCVHALHGIGMVATTSPCGAGKAAYADWSPLAGKTVYLWPDNDEGGIKHMEEVAGLLKQLRPAPLVYIIDPAKVMIPVSDKPLEAKGDVADFIEEIPVDGSDKQVIAFDWIAKCIFPAATSLGASCEVSKLIEDTISGKRKAIDWPWPCLSHLSKALLPGTVTVLCGDPSAAKSFMLLQAMSYWHDEGIKAAIYELENDTTYHLYRALVQRAGYSPSFDDEWMRENSEELRAMFKEHQGFLDTFGKCVWAMPKGKDVSLGDLAKWVKERADEGCRIIAIDPVTAAASGDKPWLEDRRFLKYCEGVCNDTGASLVLATHPKAGKNRVQGLDGLAGGAAYQRFSHTVIWVEVHKKKEKFLKTQMGTMGYTVNRTLHLYKTRNGSGHGAALGYLFNGGTLRFEELGLVVTDN